MDIAEEISKLGIRLHPPLTPRNHGHQLYSLDDPGFDGAPRGSVSMQEAEILAQWSEGLRVLEIGTGLGVSTVGLALGAHEVVTVDPADWVREALTLPANVKSVAKVEEATGLFDLAFIDGLHDYDNVMRDIWSCLSRVFPDGHVAFHDVSQTEVIRAMRKFAWRSWEQQLTAGALTRCQVPIKE